MKADEVDIFALARTNDAEAVERLLSEESNDVNETNDTGVTGLHICATLDCVNTLIVYLRYGADLNIRDYESGWTALHRSVYHGNVRASVLLLRAGASIDTDEGKACVRDKDGLTPAQLLSSMLQQSLYLTKQKLLSSTAMSFGKSDFTLGVPLPKASEVVRPRRIESLLSECIAQLCASKHHSMAVTSTGACYSWGNGRSGRLGHGDEISQPEPRRIRAFGGAGKPRVKQIASGEHHTIVVSDNGDVFTWGSDRFGQLGHGVRFTSNALHGAAVNNAACLEPRRVEALRREYVLHVAAGDAHSLCITRDGEVYAWGSNKDGQLGLKQTELSALPGGSLGSAIPKRVAIESGGYAKGSSGRKLLGLAAAHNNSLLLCRSYTFLSGTDVYQWGHGKFTPSRVIFDGRRGRAASMDKSDMAGRSGKQSSELDFVPVSARKAVSIEQVAAGRDHFAALDLDGRVYAWEADAEQQGLFTAPSVVEALLPECGGARVSAIAAAANRTCAVTAAGELYCWEGVANQTTGLSSKESVLSPVQGVKRAIAVAAGADHTLVLTTTSLPDLPLAHSHVFTECCPMTGAQVKTEASVHVLPETEPAAEEDHGEGDPAQEAVEQRADTDIEPGAFRDLEEDDERSASGSSFASGEPEDDGTGVPSLLSLCERQVAKTVNVKTVVSALTFADQFCAPLLAEYCTSFIRMNLDAVLVQTKPADLEGLAASMGFSGELDRVDRSPALPPAAPMPKTADPAPRSGVKAATLTGAAAGKSSADATTTPPEAPKQTSAEVLRDIKGIKKKLAAIDELKQKISGGLVPSSEQQEKVARRPALCVELAHLEQLLVRCQVRERNEAKAIASTPETSEATAAGASVVPAEPLDVVEGAFKYVKIEKSSSSADSPTAGKDKETPAAGTGGASKKNKRFKGVSLQEFDRLAVAATEAPKQPAPQVERKAAAWKAVPVAAPVENNLPPGDLSEARAKSTDSGITASVANAKISTPVKTAAPAKALQVVVTPTKAVDNEPENTGPRRAHSLFDFLSPSAKAPLVPPAPPAPPVAVKATWSSSPATETVSAGAKAGTPTASFSEIQRAEELARQTGNITALRGNSIPWLVERRPRAESMDAVVRQQLREKEEAEEAIRAVEAAESARKAAADAAAAKLLAKGKGKVRSQNNKSKQSKK